MRGYIAAMRSYWSMRGRASRREYWLFMLGYALIIFGAMVIDAVVFGQPLDGDLHLLAGILQVVHVVPAVAVQVRRLHDIDRTGHWAWLLPTGVGALLLLGFAATPGTRGPNRFGADPYAAIEPTTVPLARSSVHAGRDVTEELERLAALKRDGALSDAEYDTLKGRVLGSLSA